MTQQDATVDWMREPDSHEWIVYGTSLAERWVRLNCVVCESMGTVGEPTIGLGGVLPSRWRNLLGGISGGFWSAAQPIHLVD